MFLDTSGLLCLIHVRETQHENAASSYTAATILRLTHSYVLDEFVALAQARKLSRDAALDFSERLIDDADIETVRVDETRHREALAMPRARSDKAYSLCDAVSFGLMRERGITKLSPPTATSTKKASSVCSFHSWRVPAVAVQPRTTNPEPSTPLSVSSRAR